jgi:ribosome maturation factor RimP
MTILRERLQQLLEPVIESLGYELLLLEFAPSKSALLRLYIDGPGGIGLEDCERVSREVSAVLDVEDPISSNYRLEVSSPGLDRPLVKPAHFERFSGHPVKVQLLQPLNGRRRFEGEILKVAGDRLSLRMADGLVELDIRSIERARLVPPFDSRPEPY